MASLCATNDGTQWVKTAGEDIDPIPGTYTALVPAGTFSVMTPLGTVELSLPVPTVVLVPPEEAVMII